MIPDIIDDAIEDTHRRKSLPDTGDRTEFSTGAVRDASIGKGLPSLIPPEALHRIALRFEDGASKYGRDNWKQGIPLSRYYDAIDRHLKKWMLGLDDEDHLGAIGWNMTAAVWTESQIKAGNLPPELDDRGFKVEGEMPAWVREWLGED